jgi:hypothetical protein
VQRLTSDYKWTEDGSIELTQHIPGMCLGPLSWLEAQ